MLFSSSLRRAAAAALACGLVAGSQLLVAPAASAAPPADCPNYTVTAQTTTTLSISPTGLDVGDSFTATATVTVDGVPVTGGSVAFSYDAQSDTVAVSGGSASATFTAVRGSNPVQASYSGQCLAGSAAIGTSAGSQAVVAGVSQGGGNGNGNGGNGDDGDSGVNRPGSAVAAADDTSGLGDTGMDTTTTVAGVLGLGLLAAGGVVLLRRRRVQG